VSAETKAIAVFSFYGISYEVDLEACRERMLERAAELVGKEPGSGLALVAQAAGVSYKTVDRFFAAEPIRVESFVRIITRGLGLAVKDVATKVRLEVAA